MTKYTAKNVLLQLADGTKVLPYTDKLSRDLSNINSAGENKLIASRTYAEAGILDDERGASELESARRSTFDKSKFTVVGSPTITEDGIASGFSESIYLQSYDFAPTSGQAWEINCKINCSDVTAQNGIFSSGEIWVRDYVCLAIRNEAKQIYWNMNTGDGTNIVPGKLYTNSRVKDNADIYFKMLFTGTSYILSISSDGITYEILDTITSSLIVGSGNIRIGNRTLNNLLPFTGSIDLKQFSITVDGTEVFNGNKTGIDQIKKDDYVGNIYRYTDGTYTIYANSKTNPTILYNANRTVYTGTDYKIENGVVKYGTTTLPYSAGSYEGLTITDGGIASGFDTNNYLVIPMDIMNSLIGKSFRIEWEDVLATITSSPGYYVMGTADWGKAVNGQSIAIGNINANGNFFVMMCDDNDTTRAAYIPANILNTKFRGMKYKGIFEFDGTNTVKITMQFKNGYIYSGSYTSESNFTMKAFSKPCMLFSKNEQSKANLNGFKIYSDGNLIYQATLKIPYNYATDGKRIVDTAHRDRVLDMYSQYKYDYHYTVGEEPEHYYVTAVGSPTLENGIASGFSTSNYLTISVPRVTSSNITIQGSLTTGSTVTSVQMLYTSPNSNTFQIYTNTDGGLYADFGSGSSWSIINNGRFGGLSTNTEYTFKIETSSTKIKYYLNGVLANTYTVTGFSFDTNALIGTIGNRVYSSNSPFQGSIDLSQFSITVDGAEVFHGYDPAIPNAITIPSNKPNDIIYSYKDANNNSYVQRANLTLEQTGNLAANATAATFLASYRDTNYVLNVDPADSTTATSPTVAQVNGIRTATGFTTAALADKRTYKAKGKTVLG